MTDTTFEEAKRCPKCGESGVIAGDKRSRYGERTVTIKCMNSRCLWYKETARVIDVKPDGTIPDPTKYRHKRFPALPNLTNEMRERVDRQLDLETNTSQGTAEVRKRF